MTFPHTGIRTRRDLTHPSKSSAQQQRLYFGTVHGLGFLVAELVAATSKKQKLNL